MITTHKLPLALFRIAVQYSAPRKAERTPQISCWIWYSPNSRLVIIPLIQKEEEEEDEEEAEEGEEGEGGEDGEEELEDVANQFRMVV